MDSIYLVTVETNVEVHDFAVLFLETLADLIHGWSFRTDYGDEQLIVNISIRPAALYQKKGEKDGKN